MGQQISDRMRFFLYDNINSLSVYQYSGDNSRKANLTQEIYLNGKFERYYYNVNVVGGSGCTYAYVNVPVFRTIEDALSAFDSGNFSTALNYKKRPHFRRHSTYMSTYTGGPVTVNRTVIDGIDQKITEVDADDSLTDDEKIEVIRKYILTGGSDDSDPATPPRDPEEDTPAGTDLSDTNSWLKKIYLKVSAIKEDFESVFIFEDAPGINFKYVASLLERIYEKIRTFSVFDDVSDPDEKGWLQQNLEDILDQLKKIKRWAAVDTVIDGVDAVADWLDLIKDVLKDGAGAAVSAVGTALSDSAGALSKKFPFSVPWDILFLVTALSAEPEVPQFTIPFDIEYEPLDISVHYVLEPDFTKVQWLSDISRLILSMTYAVGLMKLTAGITSTGKEGA